MELMMNITISSVVFEEQYVSRKPHTAMVIECFNCSEGEKENGGSRRHAW